MNLLTPVWQYGNLSQSRFICRHSLQRRSLKLTFLVSSCFLKYTHYNFNRIFTFAKNVIAVAAHAGILNVANSEPLCDKLFKTTWKSKVEKLATERHLAINLIKSTVPLRRREMSVYQRVISHNTQHPHVNGKTPCMFLCWREPQLWARRWRVIPRDACHFFFFFATSPWLIDMTVTLETQWIQRCGCLPAWLFMEVHSRSLLPGSAGKAGRVIVHKNNLRSPRVSIGTHTPDASWILNGRCCSMRHPTIAPSALPEIIASLAGLFFVLLSFSSSPTVNRRSQSYKWERNPAKGVVHWELRVWSWKRLLQLPKTQFLLL